MKHLTLIYTMLLAVACGAQTPHKQQDKTPWPIEPKNDKVEYMLMLDSVKCEIVGKCRDYDQTTIEALAEINEEVRNADDVQQMLSQTFADAEELWHKFVWLCNEGREEEAVKLYRDNRLNIDLALYDSEVRMAFHDEALGFLAYDYLPETDAVELMIQCFHFDFTMIGAQLSLTGNEERYKNIFDYAFNILDTLYEKTDHYGDMLHIIDSWAEIVNGVRYHPSVDISALAQKGYVYNAIGDYANAVSAYSDAKKIVEQQIDSGDDNPVLAKWLDTLNNSIEESSAAISLQE